MDRSRKGRRFTMALLVALWVVSGLLFAIHVLGVVSTPGIGRVLDQCPPRSTGLHELCAPVNVRVELPSELPPQPAAEDRGAVELSGPVEVTMAVLNPSASERFAYNAPAGLAWLTIFGFLTLFVWPGRPARLLGVRLRRRSHGRGGPHPEETTLPIGNSSRWGNQGMGAALTAGGVIVACGGLGAALVQRWSVAVLADAAMAGYDPAAALPAGAAAVPVVIGVGLVLVGALHEVTLRQSADLEGMV